MHVLGEYYAHFHRLANHHEKSLVKDSLDKDITFKYYFPLKMFMSKPPKVVYNLNKEIVYETRTSWGQYEKRLTLNTPSLKNTSISVFKTRENITARMIDYGSNIVLKLSKAPFAPFIIDGQEARFIVLRRWPLSRQFRVYKDDDLLIKTRIKRLKGKKVLMVYTSEETDLEAMGLTFLLVYWYLFG